MKSHLLFAVVGAVVDLAGALAGPSSADYQAGIREATGRYRGDCTEIVRLIAYEEVSARDLTGVSDDFVVCIVGCNPFPYEPFALSQ